MPLDSISRIEKLNPVVAGRLAKRWSAELMAGCRPAAPAAAAVSLDVPVA